jgi:acyl-CoA reductase-like NAD-dependent aldehyde dehydrogenase/uncharacterized protein (DUF2141 family)
MTGIAAADRMRRARSAQASWALTGVTSRCDALARLRGLIAARTDEIVEAIRKDTGKPALDALAGDVMVTLEQIRYYERNAAKILRPKHVGKPAIFYAGSRFRELCEPHGIVLIYAPYNYPFQLAMVPAITAIVAGNAVILKCSDKTPAVAEIIRELCFAALLPADLVQVGDDPAQASFQLLDARPDMIFFTGSTGVGRKIASRAAELLIPSVLELGGKDPCLVFADCNLERTIEGVVYGAFSNAGQVCVGIKRLYVEQSIYPIFLDKLVRRVAELLVGSDPDADLAPFRWAAARQRLVSQIEDAIRAGAKIEWPLDQAVSGESPIILSNVPSESSLLREEVFGPVLCLSPFHDEEEAIALANASPFALSSSVWTGSGSRGARIAARLDAGSCAVNDVIRNIANPYASFGGNRTSGYGRYHGPRGLQTFSRTKSIMVMSDRSCRERHWFPFTRKTYTSLKRLLAMRHGSGLVSSLLSRLLPLLLCILFCASLKSQVEIHYSHLKISVRAPQHSQGNIAYLVFASSDGFPNNKAKAVKHGFVSLSPVSDAVTIDAGEFAPGTYAVAVYQDVNGNRKLDSGFLGIPKEPVGASNNPHPRFGPPTFQQCAFEIGKADKQISISLVGRNG